jgi:GxxExxY protein
MVTDLRGSHRCLLHEDLTRQVIGAFFDVYNELGFGYVEAVYQRALAIALERRAIPHIRERALDVYYCGEKVGSYRADVVVDDRVLLELKVAERIHPLHEAQVLNYLKGTGLRVGLVLNFGPNPTFKRLIFSPRTSRQRG